MKNKVIVAIAVLLAAVILWRVIPRLMGASTQGNQMQRPPVAVEIEPVIAGTIRDVREFTGTVYPIYQYMIAPKVSGRVMTIRKRIGDFVRKGETIATIDDAEYQQAVLESEANLKIAQASLTESKSQYELAKQELERVQSLKDKGIASSSELDTAVMNHSAQEARYKLAQAQVEQREAALSSARIRLGYTVLQATDKGYIGERFVDEGALLSPNSPVMSVIGLDSVIVRTTIIEREYGLISNGQPAEIIVDAFPSEVFNGTVARIAPMLSEDSRVAQMEIGVGNASHKLKPGMFTRVRVIIAERDSTLIVPARSVMRQNEKMGVYLVDMASKTAKYIPITPGIISKETIEVLEPRIEGNVVTLGQHLLSDGSPIILPGAEAGQQKPGGPGQPQGKGNRE